ncbi:monovalent cation/H+ antiporter complex subunit F [Georgenia subflava]|uniref:pH regulation protein F n=1 Tax=Georgenia subflava TaxID=1622177 RepID=A0A6N7EN41_9MICO|nr:monovalent cation/H+ antiporter complex subunit F [Georgenia subflava]MPV38287.1 pH regulation protein F [Georgenia subflava]
MTVVYLYCTLALAVAALIGIARMERGPSMLDRVVALDVITAVVLGAVALISARFLRTDLVPVLVVLSIVGFVGSVTIARFAAAEKAEEARILTKDELAAVLAEQRALADEDAPVHDPDVSDDVDARLDAALPGPDDEGPYGEGTAAEGLDEEGPDDEAMRDAGGVTPGTEEGGEGTDAPDDGPPNPDVDVRGGTAPAREEDR